MVGMHERPEAIHGKPALRNHEHCRSRRRRRFLCGWSDLWIANIAISAGRTRVCCCGQLSEAFHHRRLHPLVGGRSKRAAERRRLGSNSALMIMIATIGFVAGTLTTVAFLAQVIRTV